LLELRGLVKHYPAGGESVRAVDGVSLTVEAGEFVALYGPSGSGKTTLLMLAAALMQPDAGTVSFKGRDVAALSPAAAADYRMRDIGMVRQAPDLLPGMSAVDNSALKLLVLHSPRDAQRRVAPLLERLGLSERLQHRAEELSMGERQRVMIARALSTDPSLVLADEPTGNLDSQRGREVLGLLAEVCSERGAAVLLVTHDPQAAGFADRVRALRDGRLVDYQPDPGFAAPAAG
jgi:putative ABC transport system ATP-binding protein